jgi:hypothetical protein
MSAPNIVNLTSMIGKTSMLEVTTSPASLLTNASDSGFVYKVNSILIANIDGTNGASITVDIYRQSVAYPLAKLILVAATTSLEILSKSIYLEEGDAIMVTASANGDLMSITSYEIIA